MKHVDSEPLRELIKRDAIVTGGAIASMLLNEQPNDFDFYFKTLETTKKVAEYYVERFKLNPPSRFKASGSMVDIRVIVEGNDRVKVVVKSQGVAGESGAEGYQYFEQVGDPSEPHEFVENVANDAADADAKTADDGTPLAKYRPVFLTTNAITLSDRVQIVVRFWGEVAAIHKNYDFVHCTCAWDGATGDLTLPHAALLSLLNKRLKYLSSRYPLCSLIRTRKFIKAGWHIDAGQFVKMAWEVGKLKLDDVTVLEDQMIGVDSAYFVEVIRLLKSESAGDKPIDSAYLMEVIDKVFG